VIGVSLLLANLLSFIEGIFPAFTRRFLQRLYSMFPNGWPGKGLLLLRCAAASLLIYDGVVALLDTPQRGAVAFQVMAVAAGLLLLAGLWTPVAGLLVVISQLAFIFYSAAHVRSAILLATLGIALALLGPGVLSIDAVLFGRKRIVIR